jgi:hypothetical protein
MHVQKVDCFLLFLLKILDIERHMLHMLGSITNVAIVETLKVRPISL